jgi:hypothetical protein
MCTTIMAIYTRLLKMFYDTYKYILKSPVHDVFFKFLCYNTYKCILNGPVHSDFI